MVEEKCQSLLAMYEPIISIKLTSAALIQPAATLNNKCNKNNFDERFHLHQMHNVRVRIFLPAAKLFLIDFRLATCTSAKWLEKNYNL